MQVIARHAHQTRKRGCKMKKFLSLLLATLMLASVLSGCGSTTEETTTDDTATEESTGS